MWLLRQDYLDILLNLGKFLISRVMFPEAEVSEFLNNFQLLNIQISIRTKDFFASVTSKHIQSCLSPGGINSYATEKMAEDPTTAVCLIRDRAGHILGRHWIRIVENRTLDSKTLHYYSYKVYGNKLKQHYLCEKFKEKNLFFCRQCSLSFFYPIKTPKYYDEVFGR